MLEGIVANLLNRFLGLYVKDFDARQLNVGIWSGDVKLRHLELRREALDQLKFTLNVVEGYLGELTLSIPWSNLRSKPVRIDIEDVFLLAAPREDSTWDPEDENRRAQAIKIEKLESAELLKEQNQEGMSPEDRAKDQSFTQSLITAIVDNMQIVIKNVHIRYEDSIANPAHPFAAGFTIKELSAVSTDADWNPTFVQSASGTSFKLATLEAFALYWDTDSALFSNGANEMKLGHEALMEKLRSAIENKTDSQYMLKPVSVKSAIELDKTGEINKPHFKIRLLLDELAFVLDEQQYKDALMLMDMFHSWIRSREYRSLRPKSSLKENPRAWLRYAGQVILNKIHERNRRWTSDYIKDRRSDRLRYIELFKKKKRGYSMAVEETTNLSRLEEKHSYEDLRFWRSLARSQLRKEKVTTEKKEQPKQQSWSEWIFGGKKEEEKDVVMTDEHRKELYEAIDWDEKRAISESVDVPRNYVKYQVDLSLNIGSFTIKRDPHGDATEILKLAFDRFSSKVKIRPDSYLLHVDLADLRIHDGTTAGTRFPQIVWVRDAPSRPLSSNEELVDHRLSPPDNESASPASDDSLFHAQFESNPLDESANSALTMRLKGIEVIHNPRIWVEVFKFFRPPERNLDTINVLLASASAKVEGIRQQTRAGLQFALEEHKTLNAQLDIRAPLFIIPETVTVDDPLCLFVDAGHLNVSSQLVSKKDLMELQSQHDEKSVQKNFDRLGDMMFDKFNIKLDSAQMLLGHGVESTKKLLNAKSPGVNLHIIDKINIDFVAELCILHKSVDLPRIRLSGHLPELHASASDEKYKDLMRIIDVAIPHFEDEDSSLSHRVSRRPSSFQLSNDEISDVESEADSDNAEARSIAPPDQRLKIFEFKFTVDTLRGSLYRSVSGDANPDKLLAEIIARKFHMDYEYRPTEMRGDLTLQSLSVDDHIEKNLPSDFKQIITSRSIDQPRKKTRNLFFLKFTRSLRIDDHSSQEIAELDIDLEISTINVIVTRRTLLTLLDLVLITFTNQDGGSSTSSEVNNKQMTPADPSSYEKSGPIRVKFKFEGISLILNDDGIRLATIKLTTADTDVYICGPSLRVCTKLGSLTLVDDSCNDGSSRRLVSIEGSDLAELTYETFDPQSKEFPGYTSELFLRSDSIRINFIDEPFHKLVNFLVRFGKMQAVFTTARQAAARQAIQETASLMRFDVVVKAPIIVFPQITKDEGPRDFMTANLGEFYAHNEFRSIDGAEGQPANVIFAGIRHVRLTSNFYYDRKEVEELEIMENVDVDFEITYIDTSRLKLERPDIQIAGSMSPITLRISQTQLRFLILVLQKIPSALIPDAFPQENEELQSLLPQSPQDHDQPADNKASQDQPSNDVSHHIDMNFKASTVSLELILAKQGRKVGDLAKASLSKFLINGSEVNLRQMDDGSLNAELCLHSFNVLDSRANQPTCFPRVMSLISNNVKEELTANVTMPAGSQKDAMFTLTIDSPRVILALDHMFSLQSFFSQAFSSDDNHEQSVARTEPPVDRPQDSQQNPRSSLAQISQIPEQAQSSFTFSARVSIINPQVVLVTNPAIPNTEAIVLGSKEMIFVKQKTINLILSSVGMFICRMDKFDTERLRILDDFALDLSLDTQAPQNGPARTLLEVHVEPLVLRLSLRDILLAFQIINEASNILIKTNRSLHGRSSQPNPPSPALSKTSSVEEYAVVSPSQSRSRSPKQPRTQADHESSAAAQRRAQMLKTEELTAQIDGIRIIIIGEVHELPLFDFQVERFDVDLRDWSSLVSADTTITTSMHVFNFSKSAWEPFIEPWQLGFHMVREVEPSCLSMEVYSHKTLEITISSSTIALASKSFEILSSDEDVLSKPRGATAPYRLRNYTGFDLSVWTGDEQGKRGQSKRLKDGQEYPWQFEGAMTMRQTLTPEGGTGTVNIRLENSGFDEISSIPLLREGEFLYSLYPKMDGVKHRLLVEVRLQEDNVKYITFRSPLVVDNKTQIPLELGVYDPKDGSLLHIHKIRAGDSRCAPIGAAYRYALLIRPDPGFGYQWSTEALNWRDLLNRPARTLCCKTETDEHNLQNNSPAFFFQVNAIHDKNSPVNRAYPHMRLRVCAPLEIENLLPYDFKYRVYDRTTKRDWTNFLRKGLISPVHVVELSHLLLINVDIQDTDFRRGEFAIINGDPEEDFYRENTLMVDDQRDMQLRLRLHYYTIPDSGGAFKVTIYSPYVILNMTGLNLLLQSNNSSRDNNVHRITTDASKVRKALPYMYSYKDKNRKNRTALQVDGSDWTKPQSFEAIGSNYEVSFPSQQHPTDYHAGINVEEGQGKYNLSKVIKITPRFILKNKMKEDLMAREPGSSSIINLRPNDLVPLHFLQRRPERQLCLSFASVLEDSWSAPFFIDELGSVYVKLSRPNMQQKLVRVDLLMEHATIFIHISLETSHWPFSLRNESDVEFIFFQANPNISEDEDQNSEDVQPRWRPVKYRLPPRSVMPYAWDYPASKNKLLVVISHGKERAVKLAEIGNLVPMKLPPQKPNDKLKIIDINIIAEGPTQALILSNFKQSRSMYRPQNPAKGREGDFGSNFRVKHINSDPTFRCFTRFAGIGVSLINQNMKELLYMSLRDLEIRYSDSQLYQTVDLLIKWAQVDNQLYGGIFPILVYPSVVAENNRELEAHPVFRGKVTRVKDDSYGVLYIKYASLLMQQMTVELDEDFIFAMLEFLKVPGASWAMKPEGKLCDETLDIPEPSPQEQTPDVYFELLHLQPMQIDLSFVRTERINAEDKMKVSNPLMFVVNVLTMSLGNVNDAPVRFNALLLENARLSGSTLFRNVNDHYVQEFIGQLHLIIGSADFLGNPVGLFNTVSSGVADMFYEPYQGVIMADKPHEQFGIGIARGASSFAKKFVFGFSDSFSKLTGSVSKGFAAASLDKEFQEQRRNARNRNRPKHALYGIAAGGNAFASSMASGIGGLARLPLEGAEKEGIEGFMKGVGKGFLGLATKPAVGLFDFASNLAEGVRNTTTVLQPGGLDKVRLTRFIGVDGIVRPYSAREALGQFWLKTCDDGKYFQEDYIAHLEIPEKPTIVILTYHRILILRTKSMKTATDIKLTDIHTISKERTGMSITLEGNVSGPFIPIEDEASRNWLYQQIAIAVNAFNERYGAAN